MKSLSLLLCALGTACLLPACSSDDSLFSVNGGTTQRFGPPSYGPLYYNRGVYPSYSDRPGYYHQVPSIPGSYQYVFNDVALPENTVVKAKTWRYTSRYPSAWGAPIWVTSFRPVGVAHGSGAPAAPTAASR